jgi:hypothetical protein
MTEEAYLERHPLDYEKMIARGEILKEEWEEEESKESKNEKGQTKESQDQEEKE